MNRNKIITLGALVCLGNSLNTSAATEMDALRERLVALEAQMKTDSESAITIGGVVEVEYGFKRPKTGSNENEIVLATAELGFSANLNENFGAYLTLLQGEDNDNILVDEAVLKGQTTDKKYTFTVGRQYVPFGAYKTALISDPVGLDIGESNDEAIVLGANFANGISFALWGADSGGDGNNSGTSIDYKHDNFSVGVDLIEQLNEANGENGLAAHAQLVLGDITLIVEYIGETDGVNEAESTQFEIDYAVNEKLIVALAYNDIDNFGDFDSTLAVAAEYGLTKGAAIVAEYKTQDRTDNAGDDVFTLRLAYEF